MLELPVLDAVRGHRAPACVVMIGTSFGTRGGVASVVDGYRRAGFFERRRARASGARAASWRSRCWRLLVPPGDVAALAEAVHRVIANPSLAVPRRASS